MDDAQTSPCSVDVDDFPIDHEFTAVLTMKCGEPLMAVRKKLHDEILVPFVPNDGFQAFQTKIEQHFIKIQPTYVQEHKGMYLKPSSNATQTKYLMLTKDNFLPILRLRWKVAKNMKTELKYEIFCYFMDTSERGEKKRLSNKSISKRQQRDMLLDAQGNVATSSLYPFVASQIVSPSLQQFTDDEAEFVDSSGVKRSLRHDANSNERPRKVGRVVQEESLFMPIPFRINGVVIPLEVDILALQRGLGLIPRRNSHNDSSKQRVENVDI